MVVENKLCAYDEYNQSADRQSPIFQNVKKKSEKNILYERILDVEGIQTPKSF